MKLEIAFGQVLKKYRMQVQMSQEALALECGLDRTFISALERGIRQPSLKSLFKVAKTLNISPDQIVKDVDEMLSRDMLP
ncbi:MAG: helix-turn-helix transcriptional regulator [Deltaproteobacteria bacterium]|nr:helix-turn-helix transcriptional regulator [Deltaproteobacteria bacterium]